MINIIWWIYLSITLTIPISNNPIILGIVLFSRSLLIIFTIPLFLTRWPALIAFIIFIRGVLVIFSYFLSTQPNQTPHSITTIIAILSNLSIISYTTTKTPENINILTPPTTHLLQINNISSIIILTFALLIVIITVIRITSSNGAIRPFYINTYDKQNFYIIRFSHLKQIPIFTSSYIHLYYNPLIH